MAMSSSFNLLHFFFVYLLFTARESRDLGFYISSNNYEESFDLIGKCALCHFYTAAEVDAESDMNP